jgi:hypothetical protein
MKSFIEPPLLSSSVHPNRDAMLETCGAKERSGLEILSSKQDEGTMP